MKLHEQLNMVADEHSFLEFVRALKLDREVAEGKSIDQFGRGMHGWGNHTIQAFLEAALEWNGLKHQTWVHHRDLRMLRHGNASLLFSTAERYMNSHCPSSS